MSVLAPAIDFDSDDGFLHAVLGLVSAGATVTTWLDAPSANGAPAAADDPVLDALLGLVSLAALTSRVADDWAVPAPAAPPAAAPAAATPLGELLR